MVVKGDLPPPAPDGRARRRRVKCLFFTLSTFSSESE